MINPNWNSTTATSTYDNSTTGVSVYRGSYYIHYRTTSSQTTGEFDDIEYAYHQRLIRQYQDEQQREQQELIKKLKEERKRNKKYCYQKCEIIILRNHSTRPHVKYKPIPRYVIRRYRESQNRYIRKNKVDVTT